MKEVFEMFFRKKKIPEPVLTREEMEEIVRESISYAKSYAANGNVSGMEMSLEDAEKYGKKLGISYDSTELIKIKLMGYERGEKLMRKRAEDLQKTGKIRESNNAITLADEYASEARMLRTLLR